MDCGMAQGKTAAPFFYCQKEKKHEGKGTDTWVKTV